MDNDSNKVGLMRKGLEAAKDEDSICSAGEIESKGKLLCHFWRETNVSNMGSFNKQCTKAPSTFIVFVAFL